MSFSIPAVWNWILQNSNSWHGTNNWWILPIEKAQDKTDANVDDRSHFDDEVRRSHTQADVRFIEDVLPKLRNLGVSHDVLFFVNPQKVTESIDERSSV